MTIVHGHTVTMFPRLNQWVALLATSCLGLVAALALNTQPAHGLRAGLWSWPVVQTHTILRTYDAPLTPYSSGHRGIDLLAEVGESVFAPDGGVVHFSGNVVDRGVLSIDHGTYLSSFEPITTGLHKGDVVHRGQVIGVVATSEHCTCLHLGARQGDNYLSPVALLSVIEPAVLMPWTNPS